MRRTLLFSTLILLILFSGACKSSPKTTTPSRSSSGTSENAGSNAGTSSSSSTSGAQVSPASTMNPNTASPGSSTATTTTPSTTSTAGYGTAASGALSGLSGRHSSGIILDGASTYTIVDGDTLSGIARKFYQDGSLYPLIMMVSDIVSDPDKIVPETQLIIPDRRANMNDPTAKQSINSYFPRIASIEDQRGRSETASMIRAHTR